jgi:hypothetical protein
MTIFTLPFLPALLGGLSSFLLTVLGAYIPGFGVLLNYLAPFPLFLVGMHQGVPSGIQAAFVFGVLFLLAFGPWAMGVFWFSTIIPVFIVLLSTLKKDASGNFPTPFFIIERMCGWGILITIGSLLFLEVYGINVSKTITDSLTLLFENTAFLQNQPLDFLAQLLPAALTSSWLMHSVFMAFLAQKILVSQGKNMRHIPPFRAPKRHVWDINLAGGMIISLMGGFLNSPLIAMCGKCIVIYALFPLGALGLYTLNLMQKYYNVGVFLFYGGLTLAFLLVWPLAIIVLLGFVEPWYGLNKRFLKTTTE